MKDYLKLFEKSKSIESIIPRHVDLNTKLPFPKAESDLNAVNKGLIEPIYHLLDLGGKRWRPVYGMIVADAFGMDVSDIQNNELLYYLLASAELIHNASLLIDDIEDKSLKRRGVDCAHIKYGIDIAINAGNYLYFLPLSKLEDVVDNTSPLYAKLLTTMTQELANLHYGQNWDICWHNSTHIPTQHQYYQMTAHKTGIIPRMVTKLICQQNNCEEAKQQVMLDFTDKMGIGFQIKDDIIAVESEDYALARGVLCEDIHEGKKSLMVVHACNTLDATKRDRLTDILAMGTEDVTTIAEAIGIMRDAGSIEYARQVSEDLITESYEGVDQVIDNPEANRKFKELGTYLVNRDM